MPDEVAELVIRGDSAKLAELLVMLGSMCASAGLALEAQGVSRASDYDDPDQIFKRACKHLVEVSGGFDG